MEDTVGSGGRTFEPILRTKLHRPQLDAGLVRRDRLLEVMGRADAVPLTLVSAPAGYGKSVLVSQWAEHLDGSVAWLSLDVDDSELRLFLRYFLAAVDTVSPGASDTTRELLAAGSLAPVPVLAGYLLNDLEAMEAPCSIVLDDYHRIDPLSPVHDLMRQILEHPPAQFHFIVATRQDPPFDLPSLRGAHRINEVRLRDLRFTGREAREFLSTTADVAVSDEALTHIERDVEGWAAGLRLVALALRHARDASAFLEKLPGRLPEIQEYLLREVLAAQPDEVQDCMLASSILDRFCAQVLDAVCEPPHTDPATGLTGAHFLKELRESNLFAISLDDRREWFRYHHLFQELLANELRRVRGPDDVAALHLRASQWFGDEGLIDEAIKHSLAAEDIERAVRLVVRHRHDVLNADRWYELDRWLSLIPATAAQQHAELLMARAWIAAGYHFAVEAVPPLLDEVESLLGDDPGNEQVRAELAVTRGYVLWLMGNGAESLRYLDVGLEQIPESCVSFRGNADLAFAHACQMVGRKEQGIRFADDLLARPGPPQEMRKTRLFAARVYIHLTDANLLEAQVANQRLWTAVEHGATAFVSAWTSYLQGLIHLQRCEWEEAVEFLGRSVEQRYVHHARAAVDSMAGLMLAHQGLGQKDEAQAVLQTLNAYVAPLGDPAMESLAMSANARSALMQGRSGTARRWLESTEPSPEGALLWWLDIPSITRCRAMIAVGDPDGVAKAEAPLRECIEVIETQHNTCQLIRALTLLATAYEKQDKTEEALGTLERAVALARKGDLLLPFVELGTPMVDLLDQLSGKSEFTAHVKRLVAAFGEPPDTSTVRESANAQTGRRERRRVVAGGNRENLTNRELDVLELLALRLQNKEIAERLRISSQTVNSHLKQVYEKLGVHGRIEAVERAVAAGILDRDPPD